MIRRLTMLTAAAVLALGVAGGPAHAAKAPRSCARALDHADSIIAISSQVNDASAAYFTAVSNAATAAAAGGSIAAATVFLNRQAEAMNTYSATVRDLTPGMQAAAAGYRTAAKACRAAR